MQRLTVLAVIVFSTTWSPGYGQDQGHGAQADPSGTVPHSVDEAQTTHGDDAHGPKYELITMDGMAAVWTIIVFVALLIILRLFAWKPIQQVLENRERFIADSLSDAKKERAEAERLLKDYRQQLDDARKQASAIVEEGRRDADVLRKKIEETAHGDAEALLKRARREIEIATDTAIRALYDKTAMIATDIASRIIRKELNAKEHERLISESIAELESVGPNETKRS